MINQITATRGIVKGENKTLSSGNALTELLRYHVTGAIERGEKIAVVCQPVKRTKGLK